MVKLFLACFFIAETKSSISAVVLAQYIEVSVKTARNLLRKFRTIMIEADSHYKLSDKIVLDEGFFGAPKSGKRGRGTAKINALFAVQYEPYKGHNVPLRIAIEKIPDFSGNTFKAFVDKNVESGSILVADGYPTYNSLSKNYTVISTTDISSDETSPLKLVHLFISNATRGRSTGCVINAYRATLANSFIGLTVGTAKHLLLNTCYDLASGRATLLFLSFVSNHI